MCLARRRAVGSYLDTASVSVKVGWELCTSTAFYFFGIFTKHLRRFQGSHGLLEKFKPQPTKSICGLDATETSHNPTESPNLLDGEQA